MGEDPRNDGRIRVVPVPTRSLPVPADLWSIIFCHELPGSSREFLRAPRRGHRPNGACPVGSPFADVHRVPAGARESPEEEGRSSPDWLAASAPPLGGFSNSRPVSLGGGKRDAGGGACSPPPPP